MRYNFTITDSMELLLGTLQRLFITLALITSLPLSVNAVDATDVANCTNGSGLKSEASANTKFPISFVNTGLDLIVVSWVKPDGSLKEYVRVKKGGTSAINSFVGHVWNIQDATGRCLAVVTVKNSPNRITFP